MSDEPGETHAIWAVIGNIRRERELGDGRRVCGTRKFRGGAKVTIAGCYPGTCDGLVCIGLHRDSRRLITCVVSVMHVERFRVKLVYSPAVRARIEEDARCWFRSREDAETYASAFLAWQVSG